MARPRKPWRHSVGRYGNTVRIYEPRPGAPLRWDYREGGKRRRPEVEPETFVRQDPKGPTDPVLVSRAIDLCERKAAELTLEPLRAAAQPEVITVARAYELYFNPRRKALPKSRSGRIHHQASREFWTLELGADTPWDRIAPADVWAALLRLAQSGKVPTAEKRYQNLRTLYLWLRDRMGYDTLRNPVRTLDPKKLTEGYKPRRPRYTDEEVERLVAAAPKLGPRMNLFTVLLVDSGARAVQVRHAMRSCLNCEMEPPVPEGHAPHGWIVLPAVKGQEEHVTYLTRRQREAVDEALRTYLAAWEAEWQENGTDYPLLPGGRLDRNQLTREPIGDRSLRYLWVELEELAKVETRPRRGFHAARRAWADDLVATEGLDTATAAGGWSRRETVEGIYVSKIKHAHLERARLQRERREVRGEGSDDAS